MNTHSFMFRGTGETRDLARNALLRAWTRHRTDLLAQYPERESTIPEAQDMEQHFRIVYLEFELDAGYRDLDRIT
ncbi:MAG: hypothetical protein WC757_03930 [Candidatus Paceibacterota bacterium]